MANKGNMLSGAMVYGLRDAKGWNQEELADKAGVHRHTLAALEGGGQNLTFDKLRRIANALGVSVKDFIT